jgi:hypothetical protein
VNSKERIQAPKVAVHDRVGGNFREQTLTMFQLKQNRGLLPATTICASSCPSTTMTSVDDIPPEILHGILRLAAQFDHSDALESPLINWTSKTDILFERGSALRAQSLVCAEAELQGFPRL